MPFSFSQAADNATCLLSHWEVSRYIEFVDALAWLYLRKPLHAHRIISGLQPGAAGLFGSVKDNAIRLLQYNISDIAAELSSADDETRTKAEKARDARIAHRDGLLFQHISWIAARLQFPFAEASPPHVRKADKGFDGFLVEVDTANLELTRVVICEDKASISPRSLVTGSIWPELKAIIAGERDLEVLDAITPLLKSLSEADRETAIGRIVWGRARNFRVALTAGDDQAKNGSYNHLFEGYADHAGGDITARLAEVMPMQNVRQYLDDLSGEIVAKLHSMP
jgi:hypothetical protein